MSAFFYDNEIELKTLVEGKNYRKVKAYGENLMAVEVFFENGGVGEAHSHIHDQITYCLEGSFEFTVGNETKVINTGDSIFMPSNVVHSCKVLSPKGRVLDIFTPYREDFLK